ncbi:hypothetical protein T02_10593 [Trichinella nativa]|uniref:Uncharacterized protein n=1 Tax=Trichinella nativa TaxID=6335 RepID=A0A0V1LCY6_9BILA|nr:hypothetical protein T02_10593 [Trichinella nativa]
MDYAFCAMKYTIKVRTLTIFGHVIRKLEASQRLRTQLTLTFKTATNGTEPAKAIHCSGYGWTLEIGFRSNANWTPSVKPKQDDRNERKGLSCLIKLEQYSLALLERETLRRGRRNEESRRRLQGPIIDDQLVGGRCWAAPATEGGAANMEMEMSPS